MECNKEEAIRAKGIAETKMTNKDYVGARRIAQKAQQLFPDLENILQIISVCDVHCAADRKLLDNEMDWYGILQVDQSADEVNIKKQYRKLALQLHPDKNNFAGAEAAFKLIGEAQRLLLDRGKRTVYDMKLRASFKQTVPTRISQQASKNANVGKHPGVQNNVKDNPSSPHTNTSSQCPQPRQQASKTVNVGRHPGVQSNVKDNPSSPHMNMSSQYPQPHQQSQAGISNDRESFWTVCPFCGVQYQFYIQSLKKSLICHKCKKPFIAHDMNAQGVQPETNGSRTGLPEERKVPNQGPCKVGAQSSFENTTSNVKFQGNFSGANSTTETSLKPTCVSEAGTSSKIRENYRNAGLKVDNDSGKPRLTRKVNGKRGRKQVEEFSESCETGSGIVSEENVVNEEDGHVQAGQHFKFYGEQYPRRSPRAKQFASNKETLSDNNHLVNPCKKAKRGETFRATDEECEDVMLKGKQAGLATNVKEDDKELKQKAGASAYESSVKGKKGTEQEREEGYKTVSNVVDHSTPTSSSKATPYAEIECPDPDFSDFDKYRKEDCFKVGQIWAIYDTLDAMPRFYALIRKVFSPGFEVRITWLEPDSDDEDEINRVNENLPVSCGKFRHGEVQNIDDLSTFSHMIVFEKGKSRRGLYKIYPRKGETWAIFKNCDFKWISDPDNNNRKYEYEFVEVLSEYDEGVGICVAYLGKIKNFVSLFCRIVKEGAESFQIPWNELFRFSHRVLSFKMTGEERAGVPKGSFELDPASLPADLEAIADPENLNVEAGDSHLNGLRSKSPENEVITMTGSDGCASTYRTDELETHFDPVDDNSDNVIKDCSASPDSNSEAIELPESEFYDFEAERSAEKLQVGQIWALYHDDDGLPKYYGKITKIVSCPDLELHITWLLPCSQQDNLLRWVDKKMPICCGRFKLSKGKPCTYDTTTVFSHQLRVEPADKRSEYTIFPRKGEVWALYKNWNVNMKSSDLENFEYEIVEVVEENVSRIKVLILERVHGFNSVYKGGPAVCMDIPRVELLRFSHQIPAFQLKEERGGTLRGFWELDPASLPLILLC